MDQPEFRTPARGLSRAFGIALCAVTLVLFIDAPMRHSTMHAQDQPEGDRASSVVHLPILARFGAGSQPNRPTLVSAYLISGPQPDYRSVRYRPRQFKAGVDVDPGDPLARVDDTGPYAGWDLFNTPNVGINRVYDEERWVKLTFSRPATLVIVWRAVGEAPEWLRQWASGPTVRIDGQAMPTYRRDVAAGDLYLGSVYDPNSANRTPRDTYLALIGEQNRQPSPAPAVPAGREVPQPNATCPAWVHDQYVAMGPDGEPYPTWHSQIDPVYWCYFHHEHGSDPSPHRPLFGYSAAHDEMGMAEGHEGFKVYRFEADDGAEVIVTHHFGSANAVKAACARFHTFDIAAYRAGVLVADIHLMADHGKSLHARTSAPLQPPSCPNQAAEADADGSSGVRMFQVATLDPVDYEPWVMDFAKVIVADLDVFSVNTASRIADCNTLACDANVPTGDQGEFRFTSYGNGFGVRAAGRTGVFYTNARGTAYSEANGMHSLQQFVAPGAEVILRPLGAPEYECYTDHPFGGKYVCQATNSLDRDMNIEGALHSPN